jgi:hypothetical protein
MVHLRCLARVAIEDGLTIHIDRGAMEKGDDDTADHTPKNAPRVALWCKDSSWTPLSTVGNGCREMPHARWR